MTEGTSLDDLRGTTRRFDARPTDRRNNQTRALRDGYGSIQPGQTVAVPRNPCYGGREALRREIVKERMREEIIAAEITRIRFLEAEVQRDQGFSLVPRGEWPALSSEGRLGYSAGREIGGFELLPFQFQFQLNAGPKISNLDPLSDLSNENVLSLSSKPEGSLCGVKRKTIGTGLFPEKMNKTIKLVGITEITSPLQIKINEELLLTKKSNVKEDENGNKEIVSWTSDDFDKKDETTQKRHHWEEGEIGEEKKHMKIWCEMCRIWAQTEKDMEAHKSGKKHVANLWKLGDGKKQMKFWCQMCRVLVQTERDMEAHKSGKKHVTNLRNWASVDFE